MPKLETYTTTGYVGTQIKRLAEEGNTAYTVDQIATTNTVVPSSRDDAARWATRIAVAGRDFGIAGDGTTDDAPEINAIMAALAERGGGIVELPTANIAVGSTIDNQYQRVFVVGSGPNWPHDGGSSPSPFPQNGTRLIPSFAGTVLKHRTPYSINNIKYFGGGFKHLMVIGNGIATRLLEVDSINGGEYDVYLENCVGTEAALFKCGYSFVDLAENCTIQHAKVRLAIRQFNAGAARSCKGVVFQPTVGYAGGGASGFSNVSFNDFDLYILYWDADALDIISGDNNNIKLIGFRGTGGTGRLVTCRGVVDPSRPVGADSNIFTKLTGVGAIFAEGTDTVGVTAGVTNIVEALDTGNGTAEPTAGTGSKWFVRRLLTNVYNNFAHSGPATFSSNAIEANTFRDSATNESIRLHSSTGNHMRIVNSNSHEWSLHIDGSNGDLRILRNSGSGVINLGNGSNTRTFGRSIIRNNNLSFENSGGTEVANIRAGTGTPEGAVTAPVGSLFLRTDGGASTTFYVKESGSGNTGWVAK